MTTSIGCEANDDISDGIANRSEAVTGVKGVLGTIAAAVRCGLESGARTVGRFADFLQGMFRGLAFIAPAFGAGCQSTNDAAKVPAPAAEVAPAPEKPPAQSGPRRVGEFTITFYYVIGEDEVTTKSKLIAANDNRNPAKSEEEDETSDADGEETLASITPDLVTLYAGQSCEPIADVSREFAAQLALQGTGKLHDGRVVNIFGACKCRRSPCFKVTQAQWGTSGNGRPLQPFRTIAVDPKVVKLGSLLYVPLLEGRTMPGRAPWGGYVHDGCVVADDTGGGIKDRQIDLFVGKRGWFLGLSGSGGSHAWARHVPVFDGSTVCERKGRKVARKAGAI